MGLDDDVKAPKWIFKAAAALCILFTGLAVALALTDPTRDQEQAAVLAFDRPQLVVFESASCGWCQYFRERVAPDYETSAFEQQAPLRYVDVSLQRTGGYRLSRRVTGTPTFVLVDRQGRELSRLPGIPGGKEAFFREVERMLSKLPTTTAARN